MALHLVVNMKNIYGPSNRHDYESNSFDLYCDKTCLPCAVVDSRNHDIHLVRLQAMCLCLNTVVMDQ